MKARLFGVRHLSPAAAHHLRRALDEARPSLVLVEGPSDLNDQMQWLCHPETRFPAAILAYTKEPPVRTIRKGAKGGYTKVSLSTGAADHQYGSCRVSYVDPGSGKCIEGTYSANEEETGQCLEISAKVSDAGEAKALAEKRLRLHNRLTRFASFSFPGDPALVASVTVQLEGWGGWDGKYIIKRAVHTVDTSGYTTKINARRCLEGY